jgi:hypothetical protein
LRSTAATLKYPVWRDFMYINKRFKQLKNILNFESEAENEIRSDLDGRILKNSIRVCERKEQ